jgi:hypothetical protein
MFCQSCGQRTSDISFKFCPHCGNAFAKETPKRRRSRWPLIVGIGLVAILLTIILASNGVTTHTDDSGEATFACCSQDTQKKDSSSAAVPSQQLAQPASPQAPADEISFISAIESFKSLYEQAPNEFKKSSVRTQRAQRIAEIVASLEINGWIGTVSSMETTSDGRGVLSVKLPSSVSINVETMNNGLSDVGTDSLIPQGSKVYKEVASMAVGDEISFSGRFAAHESDYIEEASVTEEGSMTDPDFIFTFSEVSEWGLHQGIAQTTAPPAQESVLVSSKISDEQTKTASTQISSEPSAMGPSDVASLGEIAEAGDFSAVQKLAGFYHGSDDISPNYPEFCFWSYVEISMPDQLKKRMATSGTPQTRRTFEVWFADNQPFFTYEKNRIATECTSHLTPEEITQQQQRAQVWLDARPITTGF